MNFLDTAYEVLNQVKKPLHYIEIARQGLANGLLDTQGQTPEASMGSRLYMDTKRPDSRFRRVSRGVFALAAGQPSDISQRIETINQQTRHELHQRLLKMPPDRFEVLISQLLTALGFEEETIEITPYSGDGGIDVRGVLNAAGITKINAAVQAKRWKANIQAPAIQALRGSLTVHQQGIFMTTSKFSKGAIAEAEAMGKTPISLIDGDRLVELLIEHEIGVVTERHAVHSLDVEWWGDVAGEDETTHVSPILPSLPAVIYPLAIQATPHGQTIRAELLDAGGRIRFNGTEYQSPSGAGRVASGWKACDGWYFWRYQHSETGEWQVINELRK
jgi:restriction system protein